ncbi:Glycosyltransferase involved in cell wall bisynthesis [Fontimonas thermophila]|uniref:Glycosyltransferase involved in cell wall bisynthesis n=1 Tax=Fontimonas thermophila TaxID=1076937 RepID=A0A1I2J1M3_9GAMM|nr:glycosyltransferase [Fontimonas thermophila]SFF47910.1 Glycosyltransferase involved in cell wall bisynthesis [Fontimonas thermophila]
MDRIDRRRIAIFLSTSGHSGVDRAMKHLIPALARRGYAVDLLKVRGHGPNLTDVPPGVRVLDTGASTTYLALFALVRYLRRARPAVLLADKDKVNRTALLARWLAGASDTRLVLSSGTTISVDLQHRGAFERWLQRTSMGRLYRYADLVIVTCADVADDMAAYTGLARAHIRPVASPVVPAALFDARPRPPDHPWFAPGAPPVILGVGELSARKDFETLIRAFARLRAQRACRLVIVGRGKRLEALRALAKALGVDADVDFPGFRSDVYAFMAHAAVFALTSRWEGLGFVLIEALACGTPCVATNCPSGPREILDDGRYGPLVPVGDDGALAEALARLLDDPPPRDLLQRAARPYEIEAATDAYLQAFALPARAGAVS